jgi:hypothetical protein
VPENGRRLNGNGGYDGRSMALEDPEKKRHQPFTRLKKPPAEFSVAIGAD